MLWKNWQPSSPKLLVRMSLCGSAFTVVCASQDRRTAAVHDGNDVHRARVLAGASSKAETQLTPEAAYVVLLQSRDMDLVMLPARQAVLAVLRDLDAERNMESVVEVGACPVKACAGLY